MAILWRQNKNLVNSFHASWIYRNQFNWDIPMDGVKKKNSFARYLKKTILFLLWLMAEALRLPGYIKAAFKVIAHQLKHGTSFIKVIVMTIISDPIIFMVLATLALWYYLEDFLDGISNLN